MIKKLYRAAFISALLISAAQGSGLQDPYGNLDALLGGGDSISNYSDDYDNDDGSYGEDTYDPYGNLDALLGDGDSDYSDRAVSPE